MSLPTFEDGQVLAASEINALSEAIPLSTDIISGESTSGGYQTSNVTVNSTDFASIIDSKITLTLPQRSLVFALSSALITSLTSGAGFVRATYTPSGGSEASFPGRLYTFITGTACERSGVQYAVLDAGTYTFDLQAKVDTSGVTYSLARERWLKIIALPYNV